MGLYLRKSVAVGPFRFNLSGSGVGVSVGVKGLRFGSGPRGNYVHMGRHGVYYRATIPSSRPSNPGPSPVGPTAPVAPAGTHGPLQEIESADVSGIVDSSSAELLAELNAKRRRHKFWPLLLITVVVFIALGLAVGWPAWVLASISVLGAGAVVVAHQHDALAKTAVLLYEMDPDIERFYGELHRSAEELAACARMWHVEAQGNVHDRKYHAGASSLMRRSPTSIRKAEPPYLKANISTVAMGVGRQVLHFLPDRVLVYDKNGIGAVGYRNLQATVEVTRFIEDGPAPPDAKVVDYTWRYVNKSGGPDRRFKNNAQLPICLYDELRLRSASGLNEVIQVSRCGVAEGFAKAVGQLGDKLPEERGRPA